MTIRQMEIFDFTASGKWEWDHIESDHVKQKTDDRTEPKPNHPSLTEIATLSASFPHRAQLISFRIPILRDPPHSL